MNQHLETALQAAMDRTTDSLEDNPERYGQVATRVRHRRQRRWVAGVAASVVLVTGSVFTASGFLTTDGGEPTGHPPASDCPPPVDRVQLPEPASLQDPGTPLVRVDPVAIAVCALLEVTVTFTLDSELDKLVEALNRAVAPPDANVWTCTWEGSRPPFHLVLRYPDGSEVTALLERGNCLSVQIGDRWRIQTGQKVVDLVYELAEAQRWARAAPEPPEPTCPDPRTLRRPTDRPHTPPRYDAIIRYPDEAVPYPAAAVAVCRYDSTDPRTAQLVTDELVTDGAEEARRLVNAESTEVQWECEPPAGWFDVLVFVDEAGGMYEVRVGRGDCKLIYATARVNDELDRGLQRWLDDVLGERE